MDAQTIRFALIWTTSGCRRAATDFANAAGTAEATAATVACETLVEGAVGFGESHGELEILFCILPCRYAEELEMRCGGLALLRGEQIRVDVCNVVLAFILC